MLISMKQKLSFESHDIIPRVDKLIYKKNNVFNGTEDVLVSGLGSVEYYFSVCHSINDVVHLDLPVVCSYF